MIDADLDEEYPWRLRAACRHHPRLSRSDFFADGQGRGPSPEAIELCWRCPVRLECEEYAMEELPIDQQYGIWGGLDPDARLKILRERGAA